LGKSKEIKMRQQLIVKRKIMKKTRMIIMATILRNKRTG
jgi:hypothetical protein